MSIKLKSCPFCGAEALLSVYNYDKYGFTYFVRCSKCGVETMEENTEKEAAELWNRRVSNEY